MATNGDVTVISHAVMHCVRVLNKKGNDKHSVVKYPFYSLIEAKKVFFTLLKITLNGINTFEIALNPIIILFKASHN